MAKRLVPATYESNVFINCPFDDGYKELFDAAVFAIFDCGFIARCALEEADSGGVRIEKIFNIIRECKYGIHDISRTELDPKHSLPRFNMPLELGMFLGARHYGSGFQKEKGCIIFDREHFRYQKFISDIAGQDIIAHEDEKELVIKETRNWLNGPPPGKNLPGGDHIIERYNMFSQELPEICKKLHLQPTKLTFTDLCTVIRAWLGQHSRESPAAAGLSTGS